MIKSASIIILLSFLIASCGRSGPLYLPSKTNDKTEENLEKSSIKDSKKITKEKTKEND